jgi:hypothetical protein
VIPETTIPILTLVAIAATAIALANAVAAVPARTARRAALTLPHHSKLSHRSD